MTSASKTLRPWKASGLLVAGLILALAAPARGQTHLDNPFAGASMYVNPDFTANAEATAAATADPTLAAEMRAAGRQPTAVWIERISAVPSVTTHLERALASGSDLVLFVLRDLPGRDCSALYYDGELPIDGGLALYKAQFIDPIAAIARDPRYAGVRIVFVVEPDSLVNLVTNLSTPQCALIQSSGIYASGIQYAVNTLHAIPNVYLYLDLAYSGWLGWPNNSAAMVNLLNTVSTGFTAGKGAIDGFATNTAQYVPVKEPWLSATQVIAGKQVMSARFYEYNPDIDEASYVTDAYGRLTAAGWPGSIGMIVDTSRNGWGGSRRPQGPSTEVIDLERFVNDSRVDRREHRSLWCNVAGAGIGERPRATPSTFAPTYVDAFAWVKVPGESDGASADIYNGLYYVRDCDPMQTTTYGVPTGALPQAPRRGLWFPAQFTELVQNAWPATTVDPVFFVLTATQNALGRVTSTPAGIDCGMSGTACSASYAEGTAVTLTATAEVAGKTFKGWIGPCSGVSTPTCVVSMTQPWTVSAMFADTFVLTVAKAGSGAGVVVSSSGAINCGSTCSASVLASSDVTLTASASSGSSFAGWSGACVGMSSICRVHMDAIRQVTATFNAGTWYPLTVSLNESGICNPPPGCKPGDMCVTMCFGGGGTVTSVPSGINCSAGSTACSAAYQSGTSVTLVATPTSSAYAFGGWAGACSGTTSRTCVVSMSQAQAVTATFSYANATTYPLTVTKAGTGTGAVLSTPSGIDCGATCSASFSSSAAVTLSAAVASNSTFAGWSGACTGTAPTCTVPMTQMRVVTATFTLLPTYPLTVTKSGTGTGFVASTPAGIQCGAACTATFGGNAVVTLTATSAAASAFGGWSGACAGSASTCTVVMSAAREVTAIFMSGLPKLTIVKTGTGSGTVTSAPAGISCGTTCSAAFAYGALVTLTVAPAAGSRLVGMSGCTDGGTCAGGIEMTKSRTVTVTFEAVTTTPCANPITFSWNTGNFNTTGAACYRTSQAVSGWGCSNFTGRTVRVNTGTATAACGAGPFPLPKHTDGYTYFTVSAGQYPWASLYNW